jgi:biotin carboxyl carrier protein
VKKFIIKVSGKEYEVEVEEVKQEGVVSQAISEGKEVISNTVKSAAPATSSMPANNNNKAPIGAETIDAPMPGVILDVKVKEGDTVKKGDVLLILEAMKMENEIVSPKDGNIVSVNTLKGASVNAGDTLLSLN